MMEKAERQFTDVRVPVPWGYMAGRWYGDKTIRPVLALHGWLDNCGTFAKLAPLLLKTAGSILCIDLPGHGYSSHLPAGILYNNLEYLRAILRLMETYNWSKVTLMGHSMGGSIAFLFAALYPNRVDIIISIDIVKTIYFEPENQIEILRHVIGKALVDNDRLVNQTHMNEPPVYSFETCEELLHVASEHSVNRENCKYLLERSLQKSRKYPEKYYFARDTRIKYITEFNPDNDLANVMVMRICNENIPYFVVKGGATTNISAHSSAFLIEALKKYNPNFEFHELAGGTHHLHLNNPEPVAALIVAFLKKYHRFDTSSVRAKQLSETSILEKAKL